MSAFLLFCKDHRQQVKKDLPKISSQQVSIELGKRWGGLSENEKKPYKDREEIARAQYNKDIATWRKKVKREVPPPKDAETEKDDLETTEKCAEQEETKEEPIDDPETEEEPCPEEDLLSLTRSTSSSEYTGTNESFESDDHQKDALLDDELMDLENLFGDFDNIDDTLALTSSILQPTCVEKSNEKAKPIFTLRPRPAATVQGRGGKKHYEGIQCQHSDSNSHNHRHPPVSPYFHTSPYPPHSPYPPRSPYPQNVPSFHYPMPPYQTHYNVSYYPPPPPFPVQVRSNIALSSNSAFLSPGNNTPVQCSGKRIQPKQRSASKDSIVSPRSVDEVPSMPVL